jgi:hypothetical protein
MPLDCCHTGKLGVCAECFTWQYEAYIYKYINLLNKFWPDSGVSVKCNFTFTQLSSFQAFLFFSQLPFSSFWNSPVGASSQLESTYNILQATKGMITNIHLKGISSNVST